MEGDCSNCITCAARTAYLITIGDVTATLASQKPLERTRWVTHYRVGLNQRWSTVSSGVGRSVRFILIMVLGKDANTSLDSRSRPGRNASDASGGRLMGSTSLSLPWSSFWLWTFSASLDSAAPIKEMRQSRANERAYPKAVLLP